MNQQDGFILVFPIDGEPSIHPVVALQPQVSCLDPETRLQAARKARDHLDFMISRLATRLDSEREAQVRGHRKV